MKAKKAPRQTFTIDRSKWLCGELIKRYEKLELEAPSSTLLDEDGRMCCLGFFARACGLPNAALRRSSGPDELRPWAAKRLPSWLVKIDTSFTDYWPDTTRLGRRLINVNDDVRGSAEAREKKLKQAFSKVSVTCKFIGKYPTPEAPKASK